MTILMATLFHGNCHIFNMYFLFPSPWRHQSRHSGNNRCSTYSLSVTEVEIVLRLVASSLSERGIDRIHNDSDENGGDMHWRWNETLTVITSAKEGFILYFWEGFHQSCFINIDESLNLLVFSFVHFLQRFSLSSSLSQLIVPNVFK